MKHRHTFKHHKKNSVNKHHKKYFLKSYTFKHILYSIGLLILSIILSEVLHNKSSTINTILSWIFCLASLYLFGKTTWLVLKKINRLNLISDLTIWLLRIFSAIIFFIGAYILIAIFFVSLFVAKANFSIYPLAILCLCLTIIGAFGTFRFRRRHNLIGVWH